jgi:hypothetical protein
MKIMGMLHFGYSIPVKLCSWTAEDICGIPYIKE